MTELYDDHEVIDRKVKITKAGDGLSEALKINPEGLKAGHQVDIVLRGIVAGSQFKPADAGEPDGDYIRIDNIQAVSATVVASDVVKDILDDHEAKVTEARRLAKEAKDGIERIPFDDDGTDADQAGEDGTVPDNVQSITGDPDLESE